MTPESTERRFIKNVLNERRAPISLQKKLVENNKRLISRNEQEVPDITDLMNDVFYGARSTDKRLSNGNGRVVDDRHDQEDFDSSTRSASSRSTRSTQEWLEEAKRIVASSPSRIDSPSRLAGSPRFASSQGRISTSSLEKRDPFDRSARRHRARESFSGEILLKTAKHSKNKSEPNCESPPGGESPVSDVTKLFSNILKIADNPTSNPYTSVSPDPTPPSPSSLVGPPLAPRQSLHRRSRFQNNPNAPLSQPIPTPTNPPSISKRNFKDNASTGNDAFLDTPLLCPPKHLVESTHRRSLSSTTCSRMEAEVLSPPRNLVESTHRRSISSSTCSVDRILPKSNVNDMELKGGELNGLEMNKFLKEQRIKIGEISSGEINGKAKIVLSGPSNSTSSMVAAICYAWLLENKTRAHKKGGEGGKTSFELVVPVMNMTRRKMWKQKQTAWLFHHVGLDSTALLYANEIDLETMIMEKQLSMLVVGEDILRTNNEVVSGCTILTDNYCEDAYDLLETPMVKKLLLAGILLDTQNLNMSTKLSMTRDAEAIQLLSVGSAPNYRNALFDQLMQDPRDNGFFEVLRHNYGKPSGESNYDGGASIEQKISEKYPFNEKSTPSEGKNQKKSKDETTHKASPMLGKHTASPMKTPMQAPPKTPVKSANASQGKNKNFFAKLFGFGSKQ